ncbi:MAG: IS4 family transposase, partial [Bdellovibrionales bacterium]|nr:IS4 family transposase [Bdellovibrionales bacterium]
NEFAHVELGDQRLNKRLLSVAETLNDSPASSIPTMTNGEMAQLKGLYRFFQNDKVSEEKILQNHYANTVERMDSYNGKILLLNDSCFVTPRKGMDGLMSRGKGKENCVRTHYGLAVSANGRHIFGIINFNILNTPISEKHPELQDESDIWIKTAQKSIENIFIFSSKGEKLLSRCLFLADREGDEFELMDFLLKNDLGFIIRSQYNRNIFNDEKQKSNLLEKLKESKKCGKNYEITAKKEGRLEKIKVETRFLKNISIISPQYYKGGSKTLELNMALVKEKSECQKPVEWRLWTTEEVSNAQSLKFVIESYKHRWKIEEVNKGAKTGVRVEERQFTDLKHFTPFLAMAFVIGWRIVALRTIEEVSPNIPLKKGFEEDEVLYIKAQAKEKNLGRMKTIKDGLRLIAMLGGFTGAYKRPGWQILWQGWMKFYERVSGYKLAKNEYSKKIS